jgi:hypothetical protein
MYKMQHPKADIERVHVKKERRRKKLVTNCSGI